MKTIESLPEIADTESAEDTSSQSEQDACSFSDFAEIYRDSSEFPGPAAISRLFGLMREGKVKANFGVPGVKITFIR